MHPIASCCAYYCSCLAIVGVVYFAILIGLVEDKNMYLVGEHSNEDQLEDVVEALIIAIIVNAACFVACVGAIVFDKYRNKLETEDEEEIALQANAH